MYFIKCNNKIKTESFRCSLVSRLVVLNTFAEIVDVLNCMAYG